MKDTRSFLDSQSSDDSGQVDSDTYCKNPTIMMIEGLVACGKYLMGALDHLLERPTDPLTPGQVDILTGLECRIKGLRMSGDGDSVRKGARPRLMYADYEGQFLGTAYGHKFDVFVKIDGDKRKQEVIAEIMQAYLPDSVEKQ